jgi:hypothetical protein
MLDLISNKPHQSNENNENTINLHAYFISVIHVFSYVVVCASVLTFVLPSLFLTPDSKNVYKQLQS